MKLVSIILLNWNGKTFLEQCIASVLSQTYFPIELFVIDNASTDGSADWIKKNFASLTLIENEQNIGFAGAINQGIRIATGAYIIPLNFDVILTDNFVEEMVKAAEDNENVGSVSGKLLRFEKQEEMPHIDSTGHVVFRNRLAVNRGESEIDRGQYDVEEEVFGTCGAAPLYRREMLEDVKVDGEYYDESFFAFWEDIDLDWRARLRGWKTWYNPRAVAYHQRGGPSVRRSKVVEFYNYRNRYLVILKNDQFVSLLRAFPQILFTEMLKGAALLFRCPSALASWVNLTKLIPGTLAKRRVIQKRRVVSQRELEKWLARFNYGKWIRRHLLGEGHG